jgi:ABC-type Mn2+/Zn2+ transport system permease subunit
MHFVSEQKIQILAVIDLIIIAFVANKIKILFKKAENPQIAMVDRKSLYMIKYLLYSAFSISNHAR